MNNESNWRERAEKAEAALERFKCASMCELAASNLNLKHYADEWEGRTLKAEAACAEMRSVAERYFRLTTAQEKFACLTELDNLLDRTSCGKGWVSPEEARRLNSALADCKRLYGQIASSHVDLTQQLKLAVEALEAAQHFFNIGPDSKTTWVDARIKAGKLVGAALSQLKGQQ